MLGLRTEENVIIDFPFHPFSRQHNCNNWANVLMSCSLCSHTTDNTIRLNQSWWLSQIKSTCSKAAASSSLAGSLDNDKQSRASDQPAASCPDNTPTTETPASGAGGEVKLRERRRRESAPVIGVPDPDHPHPSGCHSQQVRGARRISKGSQRAMLVSCLSEDSTLEGLDPVGDINTPKGSRRNFIELMMSSSPQVGAFVSYYYWLHSFAFLFNNYI